METPEEGNLAEIAKLEKRICTMEAMIVQLFRLYNDLALSLAEEKLKQPPGSGEPAQGATVRSRVKCQNP
ncbi:hypothetical protein [Anaeroselena agilis]|uniref:Uncharacterized protein n=1 Tax=Anaeroselena agilis TaxID=3063788 RepID=A0ABU3P1J4_9FIRM|nr:hypothetical protein [Selenomonadales bacterium 4137-cl]